MGSHGVTALRLQPTAHESSPNPPGRRIRPPDALPCSRPSPDMEISNQGLRRALTALQRYAARAMCADHCPVQHLCAHTEIPPYAGVL